MACRPSPPWRPPASTGAAMPAARPPPTPLPSMTSTSPGMTVAPRPSTSSSPAIAWRSASGSGGSRAPSWSARPASVPDSTCSAPGPASTPMPRPGHGCTSSPPRSFRSTERIWRGRWPPGRTWLNAARCLSRSGPSRWPACIGYGSTSGSPWTCTWATPPSAWRCSPAGSTPGSWTASRPRRTPRCGGPNSSRPWRPAHDRAPPSPPSAAPGWSSAAWPLPASPGARPRDSGASARCCAARSPRLPWMSAGDRRPGSRRRLPDRHAMWQSSVQGSPAPAPPPPWPGAASPSP